MYTSSSSSINVEIDGATTLHSCSADGNRLIVGDKRGEVILVDAQRKLILDWFNEYKAPEGEGDEAAPEPDTKRVIHISSASIPWGDSYLNTVAVVSWGVSDL